MTWLIALLPTTVMCVAGYIYGYARGEDHAYHRGYHEGGFDAIHMPDHYERTEARRSL